MNITGRNLFYIALIVYSFERFLLTTMFTVPSLVTMLCSLVTGLLLVTKMLFFERYSLERLIGVGLLLLLAVMSMIMSGDILIVLLMLFIINARGIEFENIIRLHLITVMPLLLIAMVAAFCGVIPSLQYDTVDGIRNSFGIVYPTDFAAHVLYMVLEIMYISRRRITIVHYATCIILAAFLYVECYAKLDTICLLLIAIGFWWAGLFDTQLRQIRKQPIDAFVSSHLPLNGVVGIIVMPITAIVMYILTIGYAADSPFYEFVVENFRTLNMRFKMGAQAIDNYGLSIFGKHIEFVGYGGSTNVDAVLDTYNFVDCSYLNIALRFGLIIAILVITFVCILAYRYKYDNYMIVVIVVISISSMIDHHLIDLSYNPFILGTFALMYGTEEERNENEGYKFAISSD